MTLTKDALVTETIIRAIVPRPDVSLVTTFWFAEVANERTFLFPPILRREVRELPPSEGDHVLVYFTQGFAAFLDRLAGFPRERFLVYGTGREGERGNCVFRGFSREGFLRDLAACKAVIATAGFTLITEALHLGKPYLALPMKGQFEQSLNALLLGRTGYGKNGWRARPEDVGDFLYHLPEHRARLATYPSPGNGAIERALDELLADDAALARERHRRRGGAD
ncbi:MAG: glycosyltransferase family protein [Planctomycetota bacterium]